MTIERKNPLSAYSTPANKEVITASTVETASYTDGLCPHCNKPMISTLVENMPAYVCLEHRTALPVKEM